MIRAGFRFLVGAGALAVLLGAGRGSQRVGSPPTPAASGDPARAGTVVLRAPWGGAPGAFGHHRPAEGEPEGPAALAVDERGRLYVLDQVNARVQVFEAGRATRVTPLPRDTYADIVLDRRGGFVLLDRIVAGTVTWVSPHGRIVTEVPIAGPGIAEPGGATAVFAYDDGVWIEYEHRELVRVADAAGRPDELRPRLMGRLSTDGGRILRAALDGPGSVRLWSSAVARPDQALERFARVDTGAAEARLLELETDARGRTVVVALAIDERPVPPFDVFAAAIRVIVLAPDGREEARFHLRVPESAEAQFRPIRLGADGALYQLACSDEGVEVRRVEP